MDKNTTKSVEISETEVGESGLVLHQNFENLSTKKQKDLIVTALHDTQIQLVQTLDEVKELELQAKKLNAMITRSKEMKQLKEIRAQIKQGKKVVDNTLAERNGMLHLTKKLGLNLTNEVNQMKQIK